MEILPVFSLKKYNTFGIEAKAKQFVAVHSNEDLKTILQEKKSYKKFILDGCSNMLLTKDVMKYMTNQEISFKLAKANFRINHLARAKVILDSIIKKYPKNQAFKNFRESVK